MKLWLASFPRSGNTFFRNILYYCYGIESSTYHNEKHYPLDPDYAKFTIVKTHLLPSDLPAGKFPVVYLIRDGRDSLVSMAHQKKDLLDKGEGNFQDNLREAIIAADGSYFGGWSKNVEQWMDKADIVIRYEDLVADPFGSVERLRTLIDLPQPDKSKLPTFEKLKSGEAYFGKGELTGLKLEDPQQIKKAFFRKGKQGAWREEMPEELHDLFWNYHGEIMERVGYTYSGGTRLLDDLYDSHWKQKISPYELPKQNRRKILVEANKLLPSNQDGVKRYLVELLEAFRKLQKDTAQKWEIDVLVLQRIYPLDKYEAFTTMPEVVDEKQNRHFFYEEVLLFIRKIIKWITPKVIYDTLAPVYRKRFRKNVLDYREKVTFSNMPDEIKEAYKAGRAIDRFEAFDLVHIPLPQNFGNIMPTAKPLVFTIHDVSHKLFPQFHMEGNVTLAEAGMDCARERHSSLISISHSTETDLNRLYNLKSHSVIHEAVDKSKFHYNANPHLAGEIRRKYGLHNNDYFLSVSTIEPRKNLITQIEAFNILCRKQADRIPLLVIVGSRGWKYDAILQHASEFADRILFTGFVPDHELAVLYAEAVAFCYMSYYEGFGLPLLEAMSCRTPVMAANNSSMPEIVGNAGILINTEDKTMLAEIMQKLLIDKTYREERAIACWRRSFDFSWRKTAIETLKAYDAALSTK